MPPISWKLPGPACGRCAPAPSAGRPCAGAPRAPCRPVPWPARCAARSSASSGSQPTGAISVVWPASAGCGGGVWSFMRKAFPCPSLGSGNARGELMRVQRRASREWRHQLACGSFRPGWGFGGPKRQRRLTGLRILKDAAPDHSVRSTRCLAGGSPGDHPGGVPGPERPYERALVPRALRRGGRRHVPDARPHRRVLCRFGYGRFRSRASHLVQSPKWPSETRWRSGCACSRATRSFATT